MFDPEFESFKTSIDLRAYAASHGYTLDRKKSWRGSAVMRHANGDKIIISRKPDGHYTFYSVRTDQDSGTIIDFIQNRRSLGLGAIRKAVSYTHLDVYKRQSFTPLLWGVPLAIIGGPCAPQDREFGQRLRA